MEVCNKHTRKTTFFAFKTVGNGSGTFEKKISANLGFACETSLLPTATVSLSLFGYMSEIDSLVTSILRRYLYH